MPIYNYVTEDGQIIQKLFVCNKAPSEIVLQDGRKASKQFTVCMFGHITRNDAVQDQKKRDQQQRNHMMDYNVQFFNPLKGQSKQQTKKDFQLLKNKLSQQMIQKQQLRKQQNKQKKEKNKKTFKEVEKLYYNMVQKRKERQFNNNSISV